ncbi:GNAT family N-acetyltransferase [Pseudoroseomonas rhizosphaerae]|uniref:GNAT family N-acetyltransferase n=1 Tax=Teichococcus rhizosphaerae TaxID=1335062 RepID=A0A2C7AHA8_9PROT|nr:GNAT family N-acetyltransferase [Pseudoroseomonas rhizosphaerae]PHK96107.1 GNAT family N-acetyltransferase [Pseudoroseomonas rhizosphaerae]
MATPLTLHTPRLILRPWREEDRDALAALNADPAVMRHFPTTLDRAASDAFMDRLTAHLEAHGHGFWAVERREAPGVIGLCGLARLSWESIPWDAPADPPVEIGWRFATAFQRQGYAEEAARIALAHGFGPLGLAEIVAFTVAENLRSWALMERLGMRPAGAFEHPRIPQGHRLRRHMLYRLDRAGWIEARLGP